MHAVNLLLIECVSTFLYYFSVSFQVKVALEGLDVNLVEKVYCNVTSCNPFIKPFLCSHTLLCS